MSSTNKSSVDPEVPAEPAEERSEQALNPSASKLDDEPSESTEASTGKQGQKSFSEMWTLTILEIHKPIIAFLDRITQLAAQNPWRTVSLVAFLSFALLITGFATNFSVDVDENDLWTPDDSLVRDHAQWIDGDSKFDSVARFVNVFFHEDGNNVLGRDQVDRVFEVIDGIFELPGYYELCSQDTYVDPYSSEERNTCELAYCVTKFYNNSYDLFQSEDDTDQQVIKTLSARTYPEGTPVPERSFGRSERDNDGTLTTAQSVFCRWTLPDLDGHLELEKEIIDYVLEKRSEWANDENGFRFRAEVATRRSFADEFERAIVKDIPLVPIVFVIMGTFTALFFARNHAIYSRSLLGFLAVVSILFSIMSGFGLLFCIGVSFTSMSQLLPFVMFGIGLDDAFIIFGSYARTDPDADTLDRLRHAIKDIGVSITLTSITSSLAFAIGCISSIPAVYWLCLYAFPTILFVYFYQLTFFVACIVLDERRIQSRRRDCLVCVVRKPQETEDERPEETGADVERKRQALYQSWMRLYADLLLRRPVKGLIVIIFICFTGACAYSASQMTQEFSFTEVVPDDSYMTDFVESLEEYGAQTVFGPFLYFRDVDQSNTTIQDQMIGYVDDIVAMDTISQYPDNFWLADFRDFVNVSDIQDKQFEDQLDLFLKNSVFFDLYDSEIERTASGDVFASRVRVQMDKVNEKDVNQQVDVLFEQRDISRGQTVNIGASRFPFFTYDDAYNQWEFYSVSVDELILSTIIGVAVMSGIAFVFVPHWTAIFVVLPSVSMLYIQLMGILQWAQVHINAVIYVCLVLSIGLLVDFVLHMVISYYESEGIDRREKTVKMLETMGVSICVGGISTFLGTLPLAFSTSAIFHTVFLAFLGLVLTGTAHALILLPVILSTIGPQDQVANPEKSISRRPRGTTKIPLPKEATAR